MYLTGFSNRSNDTNVCKRITLKNMKHIIITFITATSIGLLCLVISQYVFNASDLLTGYICGSVTVFTVMIFLLYNTDKNYGRTIVELREKNADLRYKNNVLEEINKANENN